MAVTFTIGGQKGGTGKSTTAIALAAHWHERGLRVLLVDADPQGTAATWADVASEHGHPAPPCVRVGDSLRRDVPKLGEAFDVVIIDAPGRAAGARQVGALLVADVAVLPCGPSAPDAWGLAASVEAVRQVQELRPDLRAFLLLNKADRTAMTRSAQDALAAVGLPVLARSLGARVAYAEALAAGRSVTSYASGSIAAHELRQLAAELETLAGLTIGDADHD